MNRQRNMSAPLAPEGRPAKPSQAAPPRYFGRARAQAAPSRRRRPQLEQVEDRILMAGDGPTVVDPNLAVRTVASGLEQPIAMAFIGSNDMLVLEKGTGQVERITNGVSRGPVLDLAVNSASERGLLGIAVAPDFPKNPRVYLYWTESTTGADSTQLADVPLLGNRVDSFVWNGSNLAFEKTLIRLRSFQADANQPLRGNHNGGVIDFGPDGKLYIFIGDNGRRGWMQNLGAGPSGTGQPDDQFGGPAPDDAHLTGVVLRLNPDGSTPRDNPFARITDRQVAQLAASYGLTLAPDVLRQSVDNLRKVFSYGHRNGFGMAFDPKSGDLWLQENGDDSFSELNRVEPGENGGWVQVAGPIGRIGEFRQIETTFGGRNLQQIRWSPENIANTPQDALARLVKIPGSHYSDPEFSWKWEVAPGGVGFLDSKALGNEYRNDLFLGAATPALEGGYLFRFDLTGNRRNVDVSDPRLRDLVADNLAKHDRTESESLIFGKNFGVGTDILTGPNGNLYVVSLSNNSIYEIYRPTNDNGPGHGHGRPNPRPRLANPRPFAFGAQAQTAADTSGAPTARGVDELLAQASAAEVSQLTATSPLRRRKS